MGELVDLDDLSQYSPVPLYFLNSRGVTREL